MSLDSPHLFNILYVKYQYTKLPSLLQLARLTKFIREQMLKVYLTDHLSPAKPWLYNMHCALLESRFKEGPHQTKIYMTISFTETKFLYVLQDLPITQNIISDKFQSTIFWDNTCAKLHNSFFHVQYYTSKYLSKIPVFSQF